MVINHIVELGLLEDFLWSGKPPRIKNKVLYNKYEFGGLRMTNLNVFITAQKINFIKRLVENESLFPAKYLTSFIEMNFKDFLKTNADIADLPQNIPAFYKEVLTGWFSLKEDPKHNCDIQRVVICYNKFIRCGGRILFNKNMYSNGLTFLDNILDRNGHFISFEELCDTDMI